TITTQRVFGGDSGTFDLVINGNIIATIPYSDTAQTTTIPCNISQVTSFVINNNTNPSNRVMFDDLKWTCGLLSNEEFSQETFNIYPNPVSNQLNIQLNSTEKTQIEIYNILGKRVLTKTIHQSQSIQLDNLNSGVYILKLTQGNTTISKKLIKK
ncbi:MAG TPA: endonuclease I, partial [Xanthomarina gelatinilytica]|nr:endonuclease I [Xanthomarina gelatinilytica]